MGHGPDPIFYDLRWVAQLRIKAEDDLPRDLTHRFNAIFGNIVRHQPQLFLKTMCERRMREAAEKGELNLYEPKPSSTLVVLEPAISPRSREELKTFGMEVGKLKDGSARDYVRVSMGLLACWRRLWKYYAGGLHAYFIESMWYVEPQNIEFDGEVERGLVTRMHFPGTDDGVEAERKRVLGLMSLVDGKE
jgi:hypothetical protein